jgi:hypothetical protein
MMREARNQFDFGSDVELYSKAHRSKVKPKKPSTREVVMSIAAFGVAMCRAMIQPSRHEAKLFEMGGAVESAETKRGRAPGSSGVKMRKRMACYDDYCAAGNAHKAAKDKTAEKFLGGSKVGHTNFCISLERALKRREKSMRAALKKMDIWKKR